MSFSFHQLPHLPPQLPRENPISSRHELLFLGNNVKISFLFVGRNPPETLPRAASISGSSAEFPEQVVGDTPRKKKIRSVAGIDQEELLDPEKLADPDSFFCEFNGVQIHHKICHHEAEEVQITNMTRIGLPIILLHGFGASVFSWDRVMKPLARVTSSKVLAFDRPAFGLTSRAAFFGQSGLNPYSMAFSVLATLSFIDLVGGPKAILMGHSAGCLVAVQTYFEAPEKVAALILVAPAIVAPLVLKKMRTAKAMRNENPMEDAGSNSGAGDKPFSRIWKGLCRLYKMISGLVLQMVRGMTDMVRQIYAKALSAVLRSAFAVMLVRMVFNKFGLLAIRNAWYDANEVSDHVLQGYTKPLRTKGWEIALLEYTIAMLTDSASKSKPPLTERLAEIKCPVLVVTGDTDRLVPSWNAERLSRAIPGSTFQSIKNCGHLPHEEKPEEFLAVAEQFLQRVFGVPEEQSSQALA